jgi:hypothetical protein
VAAKFTQYTGLKISGKASGNDTFQANQMNSSQPDERVVFQTLFIELLDLDLCLEMGWKSEGW